MGFSKTPSVQSPVAWALANLSPNTGAGRFGYSYAATYSAGTAGAYLKQTGRVVNSITALKALLKTENPQAFVTGYYAALDGGGGAYYYDSTDTTSSDNGGTIIVATDGGRWKLVPDGIVTAKQFGAKGDDATDDTSAIVALITYARTVLPAVVRIPKGIYRYTTLGNIVTAGLTIVGDSHRSTILKCTSGTANHNAIYADAFQAGLTGDDATAPFIAQFNLRDLTVEGNASTAVGFRLQGLARCEWRNVFFRTGKAADGIAFHMSGVQLSAFEYIGCSTDLDSMATVPYEGLRLEAGTRDSVNIGNTSNCRFVQAYFEGLQIGVRLAGADQTIFDGGSFESCDVYGLLVASGSRYNTVNGVGFENLGATADVLDAGISTRYTNIYSSQKFKLADTSRHIRVEGGFFERVEVEAGGHENHLSEITVNNWATGSGGYFDFGTNTKCDKYYDADSATYVYPLQDRVAITIGASPFEWTNTFGDYQEVIITGGTITQILQYNGADNWTKPFTSPTAHIVAPGEKLNVSYSVVPTGMSRVPRPGLR